MVPPLGDGTAEGSWRSRTVPRRGVPVSRPHRSREVSWLISNMKFSLNHARRGSVLPAETPPGIRANAAIATLRPRLHRTTEVVGGTMRRAAEK
jgi:hypothetical protein